jgi:hypothetical protein
MALCAALAPAVLATAPLAAAAAAVTDPAAVELMLRHAVLRLFRDPPRMMEVVRLSLPPEEERRTRLALAHLFRRSSVRELSLEGVTAAGHVRRMRLSIADVDVFGLRVAETVVTATEFEIDW